jgi:hypothetical protein
VPRLSSVSLALSLPALLACEVSDPELVGRLTGAGWLFPLVVSECVAEGARPEALDRCCSAAFGWMRAHRQTQLALPQRTMTSSLRPRPTGCRSIVNAITSRRASSRPLLVHSGSVSKPAPDQRDHRSVIPPAQRPTI